MLILVTRRGRSGGRHYDGESVQDTVTSSLSCRTEKKEKSISRSTVELIPKNTRGVGKRRFSDGAEKLTGIRDCICCRCSSGFISRKAFFTVSEQKDMACGASGGERGFCLTAE